MVEDRLVTDVGGTIGVRGALDPGDDRDDGAHSAILAYENLPEGKATVGFEVCVKHVAAAAEGASCTVRATLREVVDGRKLRFDVEVTRGRAHDRRRHPRAPGDRRRRSARDAPGLASGDEPSFRERVRIREVGPRDGFQNEPEVIPTGRQGAADRDARARPGCGGSR